MAGIFDASIIGKPKQSCHSLPFSGTGFFHCAACGQLHYNIKKGKRPKSLKQFQLKTVDSP
jgi:hypothetical protein